MTSFLGVSLSLFDFLQDGIRQEATTLNPFYAVLLSFSPPEIAVSMHVALFHILTYSSIFVVLLLYLIPLGTVIKGRQGYS